jgi:hypothetical protein
MYCIPKPRFLILYSFSRLETERIVLVEACTDVLLRSGITLRNKKVYCIFYWNKVEVGRTEAKVAHPRLERELAPISSPEPAPASTSEPVPTASGEESPQKPADDAQSTTAPVVATEAAAPPVRRLAMVNAKRFIDTTWALDDYASYIYFSLTPQEVPTKEGSILEVELVVDISKREAAQGTMLGRMS